MKMKKRLSAVLLLLALLITTACAAVYAGNGLPSWYPDDVSSFKFYHDEKAPRVVDNADLFTDSEERAMEARIK